MATSILRLLALVVCVALSSTAALAESPGLQLEGVRGPFAWRVTGLRRTQEVVDGREHEILWMTLSLAERAGRAWTIEAYEARGHREGYTEALAADAGPWPVRPRGARAFRFGAGAPCIMPPGDACGVALDQPVVWSVRVTGSDDAGRPFRTVIDITLPAALYARLAPAPPMRVTPVTAGATTGSLPITTRARLVTLEATLAGGHRITLLLDTGAQMTMLTPQAAARAGLVLSPESEPFPVMLAAGGDATIATTVLPSLRLGEFVVENLEVGVGPLSGFSVGGEPIGGLLGTNVLDQFTFTVDRRAGQLRLELVR